MYRVDVPRLLRVRFDQPSQPGDRHIDASSDIQVGPEPVARHDTPARKGQSPQREGLHGTQRPTASVDDEMAFHQIIRRRPHDNPRHACAL